MTLLGQAGAIWLPVPANNIFPGYWGNTPKWVVLHKTASSGTAQDIANFFINDPAEASSHYIVGLDGTLVQCVSESDGAGANGILETGHATYLPTNINLNCLTISIEHVDPDSNNSTPLTDAQKATSFKLVHDICQRHNIPMRAGDASGGIIKHADIAPIDRALCPNNYPFDELWDYLGGNTSDMITIDDPWVKTYFKQTSTNPTRWECTNGQSLFAGIRAGWAAMNGAPRLPVGGEVSCGKEAVYQECESGIVLYDPLKEIDAPGGPWAPCYLLKLDSPLAKKLLTIAHPTTTPAPTNTTVDLVAARAALKTLQVYVDEAIGTMSKTLGG